MAAETLAAAATGVAAAGAAAVGALTGELTRRGIAVRILDAGPDSEGAVAQLAADPAARDMAAWAAMRQLTPAALYGISLGLGLIAAVWFAELAVRSKLLAVAALAGSFLFARTGSLVAATSREGRIKAVIGWLGTACGLLTELGVYAALAVSAGPQPRGHRPDRGGGPGRHLRPRAAGHRRGQLGRRRDDRRVAAGHRGRAAARRAQAGRPGLRVHRQDPGNLFPRSVLRLGEETVTLPAGERLALIAVTSVFFGPRLTFLLLLAWGVLAAGYVLAGQLARSAAADPADRRQAAGGAGGLVRGRRPGRLPRRRPAGPLDRRPGRRAPAAAAAAAGRPAGDRRAGRPRAGEPARHLGAGAGRGDDAGRARRPAPARRAGWTGWCRRCC